MRRRTCWQTHSIRAFTTYSQQVLHVRYLVHFPLTSDGFWMSGGHRAVGGFVISVVLARFDRLTWEGVKHKASTRVYKWKANGKDRTTRGSTETQTPSLLFRIIIYFAWRAVVPEWQFYQSTETDPLYIVVLPCTLAHLCMYMFTLIYGRSDKFCHTLRTKPMNNNTYILYFWLNNICLL